MVLLAQVVNTPPAQPAAMLLRLGDRGNDTITSVSLPDLERRTMMYDSGQ